MLGGTGGGDFCTSSDNKRCPICVSVSGISLVPLMSSSVLPIALARPRRSIVLSDFSGAFFKQCGSAGSVLDVFVAVLDGMKSSTTSVDDSCSSAGKRDGSSCDMALSAAVTFSAVDISCLAAVNWNALDEELKAC